MIGDSSIDHIFSVESPHYEFSVSEIVPIDQTVTFDGKELELSDHTGWMSTIEISPES